jgi:hypothetical protein
VKSLGLAILAAALLCAAGGRALGASPSPPPVVSKVPLHTEAVVEVNKLGQVVRVKSTKPCKANWFNFETFGNALQMWIRHPDGTAQVGLYRVTYDLDPKTQKVARKVAIISEGGSWANEPGAANVMMEHAKEQALEAQRKQQEQNGKLPSLNQIRGVSPSPSPKPSGLSSPHP